MLSFFILFHFLSSAAFSEDSLSALQRDVVLAKEKYENIAGKVDTVDLTLDKEKTERIHQEAESLMRDLEKGHPVPASAAKEEPPQQPQSFTFLQRQDEQFERESKKGKWWHWPKFGFLSPAEKNAPKKSSPLCYGAGERISEGESLYKVAVSDGKVTIQEAVEVALANNIQMLAGKKNLEVADAKLAEAKRALYPTVQAVSEINGGHVSGVPPSGPLPVQRFYKGETRKISFAQPLYNGGELASTVKQAEENLQVAKAEYKKGYNDFVHQVRVAYYGVVKAEYNAQYQVELFEKVSQILKQVKEEQKQKLIAEVEALNVESRYYQTLYQVEASKNDVVSADVSLRQTMNLDSEEPIPVDLKLDFIKVKSDIRDLIGRALENNANLRSKVLALEAAKYGVEVYEAKKKPHFELRGSYGETGEAFLDTAAFEFAVPQGIVYNDLAKEWFLGVHGSMPLGPNSIEYEQTKHKYGPTVLALTGSDDWKHHVALNLFDRFNAVTDEKSGEYALLQAESEYQNAKNEVTLKVRSDYYDLQKYLIQIDSSIAKTRYQEKQNGILEYLLGLQETTASQYVENLVDQAQNKYAFIQAVADYNTALSSLSISIGDPDYFDYGAQTAGS